MGRAHRSESVGARKVPAAAYVRMSSDKQDSSPDQQREHISKLADRNNCVIVRWYEDLAVSGNDILRRADFRRMISDAASGVFETILCWSQDRFGRFDSIEAGEWVAPLRRAGVNLLTVAEGEINWNDAIGRLIYTIQQEGKHTFLVDLARAIARGAHRRARQRGYYIGTIPYGYDKLIYDERGKCQRRIRPREKLSKPTEWTVQLVPSTDKRIVRTVRWMFKSFNRGMALRAIATTLNRRGLPSPGGKHWQTTAIRIILMNPIYVGDQVWNRRRKGRYICVRADETVSVSAFANRSMARTADWVWNAESDWVVVRNAHPALIDRKLFDRVHATLAKRTHPGRKPGNDPLRGLVFCGHCGAPLMIDNHRHKRLNGFAYYRRLKCPTAHVKGTSVCGYRSVSHPKFLRFLLNLTLERVLDDHIEARFRENLLAVSTVDRANHAASSENHLSAAVLSGHHSPDQALADVMGRVARYRVALLGDDTTLIRNSLQDLIERIEVWFGRHPRIRRASKILRGVVHLRPPFVDSVGGSATIEFTRDEFDQVTLKPGRRSRVESNRSAPTNEAE
jgi:DNA invertase Pin-like site-specific DNA recombinase